MSSGWPPAVVFWDVDHTLVDAGGIGRRLYEALGAAAVSARQEIVSRGRALPGAASAVRSLANGEVLQSVVTGNIRAIAEVKLGAFGLTEHLDLEIGGYGSDGSDRALLVRAARGRAGAKYGVEVSPDRVFVIGDTVYDIVAAHDAGIRSIGVATGSTPAAELAALGPEAVLDDLTGVETLRRIILGLDGDGARSRR